jgi:ABC-type branched-subunit amino acid transport system permease subunit
VNERSLRPAGAIVMALVFFAFGVFIAAFALGLLRPSGGALTTPRWVIAAASLMFIAGGCVPLSVAFRWRQATTDLVALVMVVTLAAVFDWVAFFPGERHFQSSSALLGVSLASNDSPESMGRWIFGGFAVILDLVALVVLWRILRGGRQTQEDE